MGNVTKEKVTEFDRQVAAGLAAMPTEVVMVLDTAAAEAHKSEVEAKIAALKEDEDKLTGKDNKKARTEKSKEIAALKIDKKYIDATRVVKGSDPANGNFILSKTGGEVAKKDEVVAEVTSAPKKEAVGLTPEELQELEQLKNDIIARKTQLKAE